MRKTQLDSTGETGRTRLHSLLHERRDALRLRFGRWLESAERLLLPDNSPKQAFGIESGRLLGNRYRVELLLGEGGMGQVWRVHDTVHKQDVALKTVPALTGDKSQRQRDLAMILKREFYVMAKLAHANTVKVFDYGILDNGTPYFTMELVSGSDVQEMIGRDVIPLPEVYQVLSGALNALGFIHSRLYIHCDLKASNVRLNADREVKLMDFGLLHQLGTTAGRLIKGTPAYMAPEVIRGGVLDQRTDLYSLGVLAYEMLTGQLPFQALRTSELLAMHLKAPVPSIRKRRGVPDRLEKFVRRLLAKDKGDRFHDAMNALSALEQIGGPSSSDRYSIRVSYLRAAELVGRAGELDMLKRALQHSLDGDGQSYFLSGRPGVGKTHLLREFHLHSSTSGALVAIGRCRRAGRGYLEPLAEALLTACTAAPHVEIAAPVAVLSEWMPHLSRGHGVATGEREVSKEDGFRALRDLLQAICNHTALIVCIEDLQWADPGTIEFFNFIAREAAGMRAMALGTFRSDEVDRLSAVFDAIDDGTATRIELGPLGERDVATLVRTTVGADVGDDQFAHELYQATRGNPFFVIETLRSFIEDGLLEMEGAAWKLTRAIDELPFADDLGVIVRRRLDRLPDPLKQLCRFMAPLGRLIDLHIVQAAAQLAEHDLFDRLDALLERQFIVKHDQDLLFSHDRIWEYTYGDTPESERLAIHLKIARAILADNDHRPGRHETLAHHYELAGRPHHAHRHYRAAADAAIARSLFPPATRFLEKAADMAELADVPDKQRIIAELWVKIVHISSIANPRLCAIYADKIIEHWSARFDVAAEARQFQARSRKLIERGGLFARRRLRAMWQDRVVDADHRNPQELAPAILAYRGYQVMAFTSSGEEAERKHAVAAMMAMSEEPSIFRAAAMICDVWHQVHVAHWKQLMECSKLTLGWFDRHIEHVGFVPDKFRVFHLMTYYNYVFTEASMGQPISRDVWQRGIDTARSYNMIEWVMTFYLPSLIRGVLTGDPETFADAYNTLKVHLRNLGEPLMIASRSSLFAGFFWLQRKEREQSEALIETVQRWSRRLPHDVWTRRYLSTFRALHAYHWGSPGEARRALADALSLSEQANGFRHRVQLLCAQADIEHRMGKTEQARDTAERAVAYARDPDTASTWDVSVALRTMGRLLGGASGLAMIDQAREIAEDNGQRVNRAHAIFARACLQQATHGASAAAALFDEAEQAFSSLRCQELAADVRRARRPMTEDAR